MVLKDVEALRQVSPGGSPCRKRPSTSTSPGPIRARRSRGFGDEAVTHSEVEERCRQGISNVDVSSKRHSRKRDE